MKAMKATIGLAFVAAAPIAGAPKPSPAPRSTPPASAMPSASGERSLDRATWVTPADYPAEALALRIQGTVAFLLDVDDRGFVTDCSVTRSSGYALLDETTCRLLRERGRYAPRADEHDLARPFQLRSLVTWRLPTADEGRDRSVRFDMRAAPPACIADEDGTPRTLAPATCAQIVAAARAQGETLDRPVTVWLPDRPAPGPAAR